MEIDWPELPTSGWQNACVQYSNPTQVQIWSNKNAGTSATQAYRVYVLSENRWLYSYQTNGILSYDGNNRCHLISDAQKYLYKPETEVYFNVISVFICLLIFGLAFRMLVYPFWRRV